VIKKVYSLACSYSHVNWALADQAMVSGSNFITGILLARTLGIAEFGRFIYIRDIASLMVCIKEPELKGNSKKFQCLGWIARPAKIMWRKLAMGSVHVRFP